MQRSTSSKSVIGSSRVSTTLGYETVSAANCDHAPKNCLGSPSRRLIRPWNGPRSVKGVRRDKAALSSGCEPHPATAPAGSNRSSHGGNEVAEAFDAFELIERHCRE